ncbi:MAG: transcriptional regulator [Candidatus Thermoplasmatota archaeon]|jgi:putative transcriptional regulator|nr:transcriptional regulator [Candidatus Thermoplasmatota archaeon]MCL5984788.1 transcriptional regulator [Candidatus Thermoplasmatota archaeon]
MEGKEPPRTLSELMEKIAGQVVFSAQPGRTLRKWRTDFEISQVALSRRLKTVPSVVADYEADRRASPGAHFIRRYIEALVDIDKERDSQFIRRFGTSPRADGILGMREFSVSVPLRQIMETISAEPVGSVNIQRDIHGYTILDAPKAILSLGSHEFVQVYGWTTQRVLIFAGVKFGRSPMVAIRAHPLKPAAVIFSGTRKVDPLAVRLSEVENIPLLTTLKNPTEIMQCLEEL